MSQHTAKTPTPEQVKSARANDLSDPDFLEAAYFIDLFSKVGELLALNYDERSGLSRNQNRVIMALLEQDGQTQTELANTLGIHKVSAGIYISELEAIGLVERRPHPQDGRAKCIFLTELLHRLRGGGEEILKNMHKGVIHGLSETDYRQMLHYMRVMESNLQKMAKELSPKTG